MSGHSDICLLLEGTYPFVTGGVSSWVHQLVSSLHEFTFSLAVILPSEQSSHERKYAVPENVREVKTLYLHDHNLPAEHDGKLPKGSWDHIQSYHECPFSRQKTNAFEDIYRQFFNPDTRRYAPSKIMDAPESWQILKNLYNDHADDESFIDYFWTFRFMHSPIFKMLSSDLPCASVYHSVSTGYAGLLGVAAVLRYDRPLLLTEHGIYTRERRIEISRADWIYEKDSEQIRLRRSQGRFKELWNNLFTSMSSLCYEYANEIITLFRGNQLYQIRDGADEKRMKVIPNGVDIDAYTSLQKEPKNDPEELVLGLMGRVVSIKDVKTFIRACKGVANVIPKLKVYIMGPTDEELAYFEECVKLVELLGLADIIEFTGKIDVKEYYPRLDILVLTSISEAQPLVILEANCMGIPVVSTDVGACRELLYGRTKEDKALGKSGLIAGITNSEEISRAILKIWRTDGLLQKMGETGKQRVARFYNKTDLDDKYRDLYKQYMSV